MANKREFWNDIANDLLKTLNKELLQPPPAKKRKQTHDTVGYTIEKDTDVYKTTNQFIEHKLLNGERSTSSSSSVYTLKNVISGRNVKIYNDKNITFKLLKEWFGEVGHVLSYRMAESYKTKLMFDFDCKKCKDNACDSLISVDLLEGSVYTEICNYINEKLSIDNAYDLCVIFKKTTSCNLHIYFNITVTLPMYEILKKQLKNYLNADITKKYKIDDIIALDLPYSTKDGYEIYKPVIGNNYEHFTCFPDKEFYDITLQVTTNVLYESHINLGNFEVKNDKWIEEFYEVKYLSTPLEFNCTKSTQECTLFKNIKLANIKINTDYNTIHEYFKIENQYLNEGIDNNFEINFGSEIHKKMLVPLLKLSDLLNKNIYENILVEGNVNKKLSLLLRFMMIEDCNYLFYAICAVISYCYNTNKHEYSIDECRVPVLEILKETATNYVQDNVIITTTLDSMMEISCMNNIRDIFINCNVWFIYLTRVIKMKDVTKNYKDKCITYITCQMKVYDNKESVISDLVEFCKITFPLIRVGHDTLHYYENGMYQSIASEKFMGMSNTHIKSIEMHMDRLLYQLQASNQITKEMVKEINYKTVWLKYIEELDIINPGFNFYDYFINTKYGVFNTITGLYMKPTPLLYMNTSKDYCKIPTMAKIVNENEISIQELNKHIINEKDVYKNLIRILNTEQNKLFYGTIMIPGLLEMDNTNYNDDQEVSMLSLIYRKILLDAKDVNEKLLYFIEPLIDKHKLNIDKIIKFAKLIMKCLAEKGKYTRGHVYRYCSGTENNNLDNVTSKFVYKEDMLFYNNLKEVYGKHFNAKSFALATILIVFDLIQDSKFESFKFTQEQSPIKLHIHHLFYGWENMNFSIRTYDSMKNVLKYLLPNNNTITKTMISLTYTISNTFNYDEIVINDFLSMMSTIYQHNTSRKKAVILVGSFKSGKSTFQNMLINMHGKSVYSTEKIFQSIGSGPAPELIYTHSSYMFNIVEMKAISASALKSLIGNDMVHKRFLYQNEMIAIRPLAFSIAAANSMPQIYNADEAVRDRIAPFLFSKQFLDENNFEHTVDDNHLLAYSGNYMITKTSFKPKDMAGDFSNVLYEHFVSLRDKYGQITPELSAENKSSEKLIRGCLINNNYIYKLMYECKIAFHKELSITYEELKDCMESKIDALNAERNGKGQNKHSWDFIKSQISMLFKNHETYDGTGLNGMGFKSKINNNVEDELSIYNKVLEYNENIDTPWKIVKGYLYKEKKLTQNVIGSIKKRLENTYSTYYDPITNIFKCHTLHKI